MKTNPRVKKKISKPINSRGKNFQKIFIVLGLCLGLFILVLFLNSKYFSKTKTNLPPNTNEIKTETQSEITPTVTQQPTPTKIVNPSGWTTYNSKELGLSFKYPNYWGEPELSVMDYSNSKVDLPEYLKDSTGKYVYIDFTLPVDTGSTKSDQYISSVIIFGATKDYKNMFSYDTYLGNKKNLDLPETFSQEKENVYFTKKITVANQKTSIVTSLEYLAEASGINIKSSTKLNGQNEYSGVEITALYRNFNEILDKYYDSMENKGLEPVAIKLLTELKNGTSSDKEMGKLYKDYQTLLSSIKFN